MRMFLWGILLVCINGTVFAADSQETSKSIPFLVNKTTSKVEQFALTKGTFLVKADPAQLKNIIQGVKESICKETSNAEVRFWLVTNTKGELGIAGFGIGAGVSQNRESGIEVKFHC